MHCNAAVTARFVDGALPRVRAATGQMQRGAASRGLRLPPASTGASRGSAFACCGPASHGRPAPPTTHLALAGSDRLGLGGRAAPWDQGPRPRGRATGDGRPLHVSTRSGATRNTGLPAPWSGQLEARAWLGTWLAVLGVPPAARSRSAGWQNHGDGQQVA